MPAARKAVEIAPMPVDRQRGGSASPTYASAAAAKLDATKPCTHRNSATIGSDHAVASPAVTIARTAIPDTRIGLRP
jgi:hypothetical protein